MLTFAPMIVAAADGYKTISFTELQNRLASMGLHEKIAAALASGALTAFVQLDRDERFFRVPVAHWSRPSPFLEGEPGDTLFCWGSSDVPVQFHDRPLLFFIEDVEEWESAVSGEVQTSSQEGGAGTENRAKLPPSAKPNDRRFEEAAHSAAQVVRDEGVLPAAAFRRVMSNSAVMPDTSMLEDASIERAIRNAFGLMYDRSGLPHQN